MWNQQAYLKPAAVGTSQANDHFGAAIAVSGDTVVVGAFQEDSSSTGINSTPNDAAGGAGAAYVFARNGGGVEPAGVPETGRGGAGRTSGSFVRHFRGGKRGHRGGGGGSRIQLDVGNQQHAK